MRLLNENVLKTESLFGFKNDTTSLQFTYPSTHAKAIRLWVSLATQDPFPTCIFDTNGNIKNGNACVANIPTYSRR